MAWVVFGLIRRMDGVLRGAMAAKWVLFWRMLGLLMVMDVRGEVGADVLAIWDGSVNDVT
jgi:hypothetical protein